jgi:hypothetical protein
MYKIGNSPTDVYLGGLALTYTLSFEWVLTKRESWEYPTCRAETLYILQQIP